MKCKIVYKRSSITWNFRYYGYYRKFFLWWLASIEDSLYECRKELEKEIELRRTKRKVWRFSI